MHYRYSDTNKQHRSIDKIMIVKQTSRHSKCVQKLRR